MSNALKTPALSAIEAIEERHRLIYLGTVLLIVC
jgi:hypothetical protein